MTASPGAAAQAERERGFSITEVLIVATLVIALAGLTVPVASATIDAGRVRQAASFASSRARFTRQQAVFGHRSFAMVFDEAGGRWSFRICGDGNHNGIRRADINAGIDGCVDGPHDIALMFRGTRVAVDPAIKGPAGEPGSPDPVRFGQSDLFSCSTAGSCTAGSLYLQSPQGIQYAIRVSGVTGRTRVLRYDRATSRWMDF
jgi:type II secretory pathway pseudopilin PulG